MTLSPCGHRAPARPCARRPAPPARRSRAGWPGARPPARPATCAPCCWRSRTRPSSARAGHPVRPDSRPPGRRRGVPVPAWACPAPAAWPGWRSGWPGPRRWRRRRWRWRRRVTRRRRRPGRAGLGRGWGSGASWVASGSWTMLMTHGPLWPRGPLRARPQYRGGLLQGAQHHASIRARKGAPQTQHYAKDGSPHPASRTSAACRPCSRQRRTDPRPRSRRHPSG